MAVCPQRAARFACGMEGRVRGDRCTARSLLSSKIRLSEEPWHPCATDVCGMSCASTRGPRGGQRAIIKLPREIAALQWAARGERA